MIIYKREDQGGTWFIESIAGGVSTMTTFDKNTMYIVGDSRTAKSNPITTQFNSFFITLIINKDNGMIIDAGVSTMLEETRLFIKSLFIGHSMDEDPEIIVEEINTRYYGSSQKALVVAWKDALKKYNGIKDKTYKV